MPRMSSGTATAVCRIAARLLLPVSPMAGIPATFKARGTPDGLPGLGCSTVWETPEIAPHAQPVGKENIQKILVRYVGSFSEGNRMAVAETAGCRRSSFYNWYNGATTARVDLLLRMCHELGIPLTSLVTGAIAAPEAAARAEAAMQARRRRGVGRSERRTRFARHFNWLRRSNPRPALAR